MTLLFLPSQKTPPAFAAGGRGQLKTSSPTASSITHKLWRTRNQDHLIRYERERYQRRKDTKLAYLKQWRAEHPEAKRKENQLRKERMGGLANFTKAEKELLYHQQAGNCGICGDVLVALEIDHIVPLCKGGKHEIRNTHVVHPECNRSKGQKLMVS